MINPLRSIAGMLFGVLVLTFACAFLLANAGAAPVINEVLAINSGAGLVDEDGDSSDWIEIFNPDTAPVELGGFGLTDDPDLPMRWVVPAVTLEPGGYLVVFASGKDRAVAGMELHTNFSLNGGGEFVGLADFSGSFVSALSPEYPEQLRDVSFGDGSDDELGYLLNPTPGSANGAALDSLTDPPTFSQEHGYYQGPFVLELNAAPGARILFTTNGSVPTRLNGKIYSEPIPIGSTTILRAVAVLPNAVPSQAVTRSYLFPADIKNQPLMVQAVAGAPEYAPGIEDDLAALPAISLAMSEARFFGPDGIYTNFQERGRAAEVPVSVEYFDPEGEGTGDGGFQIDAGIRIHGGQARFHEKKPMRLYFRSDYGEGRLDYPLFEGNPVQEFDRLVMRSCGHDSWAIDFGSGRSDLTETATYMRDEFLRRSEQQMGLLSPFGKFVHVFVNGQYWGMYDLHERADAAFFASHEGGDEEDWDVIEGGGFVADGDATAWNDLLRFGTEGVTTATQYSQVEELLEMDSFIDSMISRMWSGDNDWLGPVFFGGFTTGDNNRNWFGGRRSRGGDGDQPFHFFAWDAEISLGNDRFLGSGNHQLVTDLTQVSSPNSPALPYSGLRGYEEFQINFADRIYEHFFNDGVFTRAPAQERWDALSDRVRGPVVAESARWGNIHGGVPLTRDAEWDAERLWVRDTFLPERTDTVLRQFQARGLYPFVEPPEFPLVEGGVFATPTDVTLALPVAQLGEIYYTLDGTDPRRAASIDLNVLLPENSPARILIPSVENGGSALGDSWKSLDDPVGIGGWLDGEAAVGFETQGTNYRSLIAVDVEDAMFGVAGSVYMRVEFDIENQSAIDAIERLSLNMKFDDGFVAYLNGVKVAEANAPAEPAWNSLATAGNPDGNAVLFREFDLLPEIASLRVGRNVLALQGLNSALGSSDMLLLPQIIAGGVEVSAGIAATAELYSTPFSMAQSGSVKTRFLSTNGDWSALREEVFTIGNRPVSNGDLVISEISYHPSDPVGGVEQAVANSGGEFEFIEVMNVSADTLEMGGVHFDEGLDFVFPAGSLASGQRLVVVRNQAAFVVRYPSVDTAVIAGEFDNGTGLSNGGERLILLDAVGGVLQDFAFDDENPWPNLPDGFGPTLVLIDPSTRPDPRLASSWKASRANEGSPGIDENALDLDEDGLPDEWEQLFFGNLDQGAGDNGDGDELTNLMEFLAGTNPRSFDTDFDGLSDSAEAEAGADPLIRDTDGDGLPDGQEVLVTFTDPLQGDSDGDGLGDFFEVQVSATNPTLRDTDGDGSGDFSEVQRDSDAFADTSVALAREGDFLIYAGLDSELSMQGAEVVDGFLGGALRLAEASSIDYGELGDPGATSLTASLWFKLESLGGSRVLGSKGDAWGIFAEDGDVILRVDSLPGMTIASGLAAGAWHHVAMVIDREIGIVRGFFDGEPIASEPVLESAVIDSPEGLILAGMGAASVNLDDFSLLSFAVNAVEIRAIFDGGTAGLRAVDVVGSGDMDLDGLNDAWELLRFGDLDELGGGDSDGDGLSNREEFLIGTNPGRGDSDLDGASDQEEVLAASDPLDAMGASEFATELLLYSSFDEETVTGIESGAQVFDLTVPPENGVVNGFLTIVPGRIGDGARQIDGAINYGDVHDPGVDSFSVAVWFKADSLSADGVQRVVGKGQVSEDGESTGWQILLIGDELAVIGGQEGGAEWFLRGMPSGRSRLRVGEWNQAVMVIDRSGSAARVRLYVNGEEIVGDGLDEVSLVDGAAIASSEPLMTHAAAGDSGGFAGAIDDLAIWGRAFSGEDVAALYRGGVLSADVGDLSGSAGLEPKFAVAPEEIRLVLNPGETASVDATLRNAGSGRVQWLGELEFAQELSLETVLDRLDAGATPILDRIPFRYAFTGGVTGNNILDGGLDMYDTGNILNTNFAPGIPYSDGVVVESTAFGEEGRYFTRKLEDGLFVLGADLDGVLSFGITGNLGADGIGSVDGTILTIERAGRRFLGFVKRVYDGFDPSDGLFDPSVNHLIIVEDSGLVRQTFSQSTDSDVHDITGLAGSDRLYHLLYASRDGLRISDEDSLAVFTEFLDTVGAAPAWALARETAGQIEPGGEFVQALEFNAEDLGPGIEEATLRFFSNDSDAQTVDVPIRLRVNAAPFSAEAGLLTGLEDSEPLTIDLNTVFDDDGRVEGEELTYELLGTTDVTLVNEAETSLAGNELSVVLMPDAFGFANVTVRATDPQGLSQVGAVSVQISSVNDLPELVEAFSITVDEDSGPVEVSLRPFFSDIEDSPEDFSFALGTPSFGSAIGPPFLNAADGVLIFGLVANANGTAILPVRVMDLDGGVLEVELQVTIVPQPDSPEARGSIPGIVADEAANDFALALAGFFREVDAGEALTFSLVGNTNPGLFSSAGVDASSGELSLVYAPFVSGTAELTIRATDPTGRFAEQVVLVELPEIDVPGIVLGSGMRLNRQTGLWEQTITISNNAERDLGAVRLLVGGLPAGVSLYNASAEMTDGRFEVRYNRTLAAGGSVQLVLEYYSADRRGAFSPEVAAEVSLRQTQVSEGGASFAIDRVIELPGGGLLVEFPSEPGDLYMIQYSSRMVEWQDALVRLRAGGTRVQWIDRGAPSTDSLPMPGGSRFYRVVRLSE